MSAIIILNPLRSAEIGSRLARRDYAGKTERRSLMVAYSAAFVEDAWRRSGEVMDRVANRSSKGDDAMSNTYGYSAYWSFPGGMTRISGDGFTSMEECEAARQRALTVFGYTEPKWWQWWRWSEPRYRKFAAEAKS